MTQDHDTIFDRIIRGEIPSSKVYEDDDLLAFHDIQPVAPVHILLIPKRRIVNLLESEAADEVLLGRLMTKAGEIARSQGLEEGGFRLVVNNGAGVGQSVFHIHLHILGGRSFSWPPG